MKRIVTLMAAVAMLAASSVASAADNLWFSMISTTDGSITSTSGPGQTLEINKPLAGPATVRIGINITNGTSPGLSGWTLSLASSLGGTFANGTASGTGYDQSYGGVVNGASSADFGRGSLGASGSAGLIFSFDLVLGGQVPVYVTGDFGDQGIRYSTTFNWYGFVGANPISYGQPNYTSDPDTTPGWGNLPVVAVTPEPTTLVLLSMGAVALLRRRK